uniref:Chromo domain-containing protein n=1 Tax=Globodera rostochiensis TaxID=31243 RepID=A0A914IDU3_GLORO
MSDEDSELVQQTSVNGKSKSKNCSLCGNQNLESDRLDGAGRQLRDKEFDEQMITCGITNAFDGSEDGEIHCFKEDGPVPNGMIRLQQAREMAEFHILAEGIAGQFVEVDLEQDEENGFVRNCLCGIENNNELKKNHNELQRNPHNEIAQNSVAFEALINELKTKPKVDVKQVVGKKVQDANADSISTEESSNNDAMDKNLMKNISSAFSKIKKARTRATTHIDIAKKIEEQKGRKHVINDKKSIIELEEIETKQKHADSDMYTIVKRMRKDKTYEVEKILGMSVYGQQRVYFVDWKEHKNEECWIFSEWMNAQELVASFVEECSIASVLSAFLGDPVPGHIANILQNNAQCLNALKAVGKCPEKIKKTESSIVFTANITPTQKEKAINTLDEFLKQQKEASEELQ